jgi:hypothetical protein
MLDASSGSVLPMEVPCCAKFVCDAFMKGTFSRSKMNPKTITTVHKRSLLMPEVYTASVQ